MKSSVHIIILLMAFAAASASAAVQVAAQVDNSRPIYAGSPFAYSIVVVNGPQPENVELSPLKNYSPAGPSTQDRMTNNNGQTTSYKILTYELTAPAAGRHTLPSVDVTVGGQVYPTNPIDITVVEPGTTKQMDVEMEVSPASCYVGQPVVLTFTFYVWTDIVAKEMIANINFRVPVMADSAFFVEDTDDPSPPQRQAQLPVNGQPQLVTQDQVEHQGVDCVRVRFSKILIPRKSGDFTLEPGSVSADLAVARASSSSRSPFDDFFGSGRYEYKRFNAVSKPLSLKVLPVPDAGKPADFYGLVGNYTIESSATPVKVNVGDPITLTIRIGGSRYLKPIQWPALEQIKDFTDNFKIPSERSDGQIQSGQMVFTQTIRANSETVKEIPPIPLSFFDSASGVYKTVYSEPIPLDVALTRTVTGADIEGGLSAPAARQIESIKEGLSANYTSADALVNQYFSFGSIVAGPVFWILWAGPAVVLAVSAAARTLTRRDGRRLAIRRRKTACSTAIVQIRKIRPQSQDAGIVLARILRQYIADKFAKVPGALTAEDGRRLIAESTGDSDLADCFKKYAEQAEASAYSPAAIDFTVQLQQEMITFLCQAEKKLK